jgi:hypothetical protein
MWMQRSISNGKTQHVLCYILFLNIGSLCELKMFAIVKIVQWFYIVRLKSCGEKLWSFSRYCTSTDRLGRDRSKFSLKLHDQYSNARPQPLTKSSASTGCLVNATEHKIYYLEKYFKSHKLNCLEYLKSTWVNVKDNYCAHKYSEFVTIPTDTLSVNLNALCQEWLLNDCFFFL